MLRTYRIIFAALLLLLLLTVAAAFVDLNRIWPGHSWSVMVALTIAMIKALLIVLYFMHVRGSPRLVWVFAGAGFLWLALLIVLTLSDYTTRNHPADLNFKGEPRFLISQK